MLPQERQDKLIPVLEALRQVPGVSQVQQDDFDSVGVNVFVYLDHVSDYAGRPTAFIQPLNATRARINRACRQSGIEYNFLDWPEKQYRSNGMGQKYPDGYDRNAYKLEILV